MSLKRSASVCLKNIWRSSQTFVVLRDGAEATTEDVKDFCRARLEKFKVPRHVEFRSELPRSVAGKVLRHKLIVEEQRRRLLAD